MDIEEIREIVKLMKEHELSLFHLEKEDFTLKLKKGMELEDALPFLNQGPAQPAIQAPNNILPGPTPTQDSAAAEKDVTPPDDSGTTEIASPMIGTFYRAPSPEADAFVQVGTHVDENTTVCIIEAMKVMNDIKADCEGVITEILAKDATPVEFGAPLFKVKPD